MWSLHDRLDEYLNETTCRDEIESFRKYGQLVPVLGRRLHNHPEYDYELIYGARRLFVARHINVPLMIDVKRIDDRGALIAMDVENRHRKDISPYERGLSYSRWLKSGHFKSQDEIARALHISASQVSRLLCLARLPSVVVGAFAQPSDICEGWGVELANMWEDPERKPILASRARAIAQKSPRTPPEQVLQQLVSPTSLAPRISRTKRDEVVLSEGGTPLFRIRRQRKTIVIALPLNNLSGACFPEIKQRVAEILGNGSERKPLARVVRSGTPGPLLAEAVSAD
jgi:ParB family chromosome partitioning protein